MVNKNNNYTKVPRRKPEQVLKKPRGVETEKSKKESRFDRVKTRSLAEIAVVGLCAVAPIPVVMSFPALGAYELGFRRRQRNTELAAVAEKTVLKDHVQTSSLGLTASSYSSSVVLGMPHERQDILRRSWNKSFLKAGVAALSIFVGQYGIPGGGSATAENQSVETAGSGALAERMLLEDPLKNFECTIEQPLMLQTPEQHESSSDPVRTSVNAVQIAMNVIEPNNSGEPLYPYDSDTFWGAETAAAYSQLEPIIYKIYSSDPAAERYQDVTINGAFDTTYECAFITGVLAEGFNVENISENPAIANAHIK